MNKKTKCCHKCGRTSYEAPGWLTRINRTSLWECKPDCGVAPGDPVPKKAVLTLLDEHLLITLELDLGLAIAASRELRKAGAAEHEAAAHKLSKCIDGIIGVRRVLKDRAIVFGASARNVKARINLLLYGKENPHETKSSKIHPGSSKEPRSDA